MNNLIFGTASILFGGIFIIFIKEKYKGIIQSLFTGIGMLFNIMIVISILIKGGSILTEILFPFPVGKITIVIDHLSSMFIAIISIGGFLTALYSIGYSKQYIENKKGTASFYFFLSTLIVSMILLVIVQNALAFLILWELMGLSSFFLVIFENEKKDVLKSGLYYLIAMHLGMAFILTAFVILSIKTGSYDFKAFSVLLKGSDAKINTFIFILFFIGFGTKAGFFPFHSWLPKAHPAAPSPISAIMSGIMIKTGIYGILRIILMSAVPSKGLSYFFIMVSVITGIYGILYAIAQKDIKMLLAYSSIENIGIIGLGMGIGMLGLSYGNRYIALLGFSGSLFHLLNHFVFKSLLFFNAGSVYIKTHTRDMSNMGGLIKKMPLSSALFLVGAIAIASLPPLNGFISEFIIYLGLINEIITGHIIAALVSITSITALSIIGILTLFCFSQVFSIVFLGAPRNPVDRINEAPLSMIIPMIILSIMLFAISLNSHFILIYLGKITALFTGEINAFQTNRIADILLNITIVFSAFIGIVLILFFIRFLLLSKKKISKNNTWACGYKSYNSKMQYTSSSFSNSILKMAAPFINYKVKKESNKSIFPKNIILNTHTEDIIENFIINPMITAINKILNLFSWIQNGNTQQYILYGIIFLVLILLYVVGVK
ncbi:MAG: hypothetical protein JXB50_02975 [Spirochaetes bacterium]|nr:hypothetical protein [Spirochaetota bacterium]